MLGTLEPLGAVVLMDKISLSIVGSVFGFSCCSLRLEGCLLLPGCLLVVGAWSLELELERPCCLVTFQ